MADKLWHSKERTNRGNLTATGAPCFTLGSAESEAFDVTPDGIQVDPAKAQAVQNWKSPKMLSEIRSFLELAGYYRRFIERFSKIARLMTQLLKKGIKVVWTPECEVSFQQLKEKLTTAPVLAVPETDKDFAVYTDALKV
ncbi:uncharacterized mitochondrial protein AtMg00860-like [Salvia splendens]|uniref:uncharacterized mitochondrial protein AtMg00860-like n=1 Tax=Salvia splendens TaxID=180675 RepID=UPI001C26B5AC|nr:uncharacterized mitochondrial protein AtMg00860-like [Salvia splendens]